MACLYGHRSWGCRFLLFIPLVPLIVFPFCELARHAKNDFSFVCYAFPSCLIISKWYLLCTLEILKLRALNIIETSKLFDIIISGCLQTSIGDKFLSAKFSLSRLLEEIMSTLSAFTYKPCSCTFWLQNGWSELYCCRCALICLFHPSIDHTPRILCYK